MRALTFEGPGEVAWRDQHDPALPPAGALVRPLAVARCDLDTALCLLSDNVSDGYRTVAEHLVREPGADVLVVGGYAASIGLCAVACAVALGAGRVRYLDTDPARVAVAAALGAEAVVHTGDWPRRFDRARITVDNTGTPQGLASVPHPTDDCGYCTSVAIHFEPATEVPLLEMYTRGVTFHVSRADSRRLLPQVLELVVERRLDPLAVPVTSVDWADAERARLAPATKLVARREPEAAPV